MLSGRAFVLLAISFLVVFNHSARAEKIGPSFDCDVARAPLAKILCADAELSRVDLSFAQAYWALLQQLDDAGKRSLKQEDVQFIDSVQAQCGIPTSGDDTIPNSARTRNCIASRYKYQREVWIGRLSAGSREEASRPLEKHIELQRLLRKLDRLPSDSRVDGTYGPSTRRAIEQWQQSQGRPATGILTNADANQ